ncbi:L-rhamnose/proton symporter RhaT [Anaerohalosphaeraceae bacterium U12dextr]
MSNVLLAEMTVNPALGIVIFTLGGLAGAVFYLPFKKVKHWAWESYWAVYALFALLIVPGVLMLATAPNSLAVLKATPMNSLGYICLCGAAWGIGGLTWGLMIRYLGVGLGLALGCGLCSAAGTIIPKVINQEIGLLFEPGAGITSFMGVLVSIAGIVFVGMAGMSKENELPEEEKKKAVAEFNFKKGILVVLFSGLMSASLNFGLQGGPDIELKAQYGSESTLVKGDEKNAPPDMAGAVGVVYDKSRGFWVLPKAAAGETLTSQTWRGIPVLVVALLGGFAVNFLWCLYLNFKNKTLSDYTKSGIPIAGNFVFAAIAGAIWCSQFICFKTGEPAMGPTAYVGWSVLMAAQILFSSLLGVMLGEWKGTSSKTRSLLVVGLLLLVASSVVAGYSGYLSQSKTAPALIEEVVPVVPQTPALSFLRIN